MLPTNFEVCYCGICGARFERDRFNGTSQEDADLYLPCHEMHYRTEDEMENSTDDESDYSSVLVSHRRFPTPCTACELKIALFIDQLRLQDRTESEKEQMVSLHGLARELGKRMQERENDGNQS